MEHLVDRTGRELRLSDDSPIIIVGMGHLGRVLANYDGFAGQGLRVLGLFDCDPSKVGEQFAGRVVRDVQTLGEAMAAAGPTTGVITTPASAAQAAADRLVAAGVNAILNFAPSMLVVPDGVCVRNVDLSLELQILADYRVSVDEAEEARRRRAG